jgi:hypothetical protein
LDGSYKIKVKEGATLIFVMWLQQSRKSNNKGKLMLFCQKKVDKLLMKLLLPDLELHRTNTTTTLPIDISAQDLVQQGRQQFDKALQYKYNIQHGTNPCK